jgi:hypothetical protein
VIPIVISAHAAQRYVERIAPDLSIEEAREVIRSHEPAIGKAWAFGCSTVITGARAALVLEPGEHGGVIVVTVKHARRWKRSAPGGLVRRFGKLRRAREAMA